jgi:hypothetical protein
VRVFVFAAHASQPLSAQWATEIYRPPAVRAKVFVNNDTKNVLIAHRGTSGLAGVGTDLSQALSTGSSEM